MRKGVRTNFWNRYKLSELNHSEWELLCDGCGKCCLIKLDNGKRLPVSYTRIACKLFDDKSCKCKNYKVRKKLVKDCVVLSKKTIDSSYSWMPHTCAYRLLKEGKKLEDWHHLISGSYETVHKAGVSIKESTVSETDVPQEKWADYIIPEEQ